MAIMKMNKICVYGLHSGRKAILEALHQSEVVEVCEPDTAGYDVDFKETSKNIAEFERYMQTAGDALEALNEYMPEKSGFFKNKRKLPLNKYHMAGAESDKALSAAYKIIELVKRMEELKNSNEDTSADEMDEYTAKLREYNAHRAEIELLYDHLSLRKDKYEVLSKTGMTEYAFFIQGYIPQKYADGLKRELEENYEVFVELTLPGDKEDVPVAFSNNAFSAPVETITETYSIPSRTDIDPNSITAFFYYLFFGMMFSDAGYGLILAIVCGYLGFSQRLDKHKRKNFKMFFYCGVSTVFWGLMYGGFFGNVIYTVSTTFFGREITFEPIWIDPIASAMELLVFSIALGVVHILIGLGIKFFVLCRQRKIFDAVFDVGFWIVILSGVCALAGGMMLSAPALSDVGVYMALFGTAGILITGGRKSKNIPGKIFGGIPKLYSITGYVSDALSYCRLMALGLATGAIANVANMLGAMLGGGVLGVLFFVVIFTFVHLLNFAMNMLGAYVHTNRLQYVEFFSKFYEGGGRKFKPFSMNTKYCQFSQEDTERN